MIWSDIRQIINDFRRESTENFITDAELMRYANLIIAEISAYYPWNFLEVVGSPITLVQNQTIYDLPDDFEIMLSVTGTVAGGQGQVPFEFYYLTTKDLLATPPSSGYFYSIAAGKLRLLLPSIQSINGTVNINYYSNYLVREDVLLPVPTTISKFAITSDTDYFVIPAKYQEALVQGVLKFVFQKEGKAEDIELASARYNEILQKMILDEPDKVDAPLRQFRHYMNGY